MINFNNFFKFNNQLDYHIYVFGSKKDLIEKFPEHQQNLNRINSKYIKWLDLRFGDPSAIQEVHPISDCISTLLKFQNKDAGISQKYNNNPEFKNQIDQEFPLDKRKWSNPSDPMSMTIDEMERILVLYSRPKSKHMVEGLIEDPKDNSYTLPTEDLVAKVGSWNIWLPSSRENSCKIAGYDPVTLAPFTTWCTARTEGSNLFYNYVGTNNMLFYIIKDNPTSDDDWLSIGFINGKPFFRGSGTESVNRANKGLTPESLRSILGGSYETIMQEMQNKNNSLGNKAPAQIKIDEAATDINKFKTLIKGNTESEAKNLKLKIAENPNTNQNVFEMLATDPHEDVRATVAENRNTNQNILAKLATDPHESVRIAVAGNTNTNPNILVELATDPHEDVRVTVAENRNTNQNILEMLALDPKPNVRTKAAYNVANQKILESLAIDKDSFVRAAVAENSNTNQNILAKLATDPHEDVRAAVAGNTNTNQNVFEMLALDPKPNVRTKAAYNVANQKILESLAIDKDSFVRLAVAENSNTNQNILAELATDPRESVRAAVAANTNTNPNILEELATDPRDWVRETVAGNTSTSQETLELLLTTENKYIMIHIAGNTGASQNMLEMFFNIEDPDIKPGIRKWLATNTSANEKILESLATDANEEVRELAIRTLEKKRSKQASYNSKIIKLSDTVNLFYKTIKAMEIL